jgi:beta-aspartyl-peptidase (threonine type)
VGAVARDAAGGLAAATSTGGMTNKQRGRVGDTPVLGAGTWADATVAVSCTGTGEAFMLACAAHEVSARMRWAGASLAAAAHAVIHEAVPACGGDGGLIAVSAAGDFAAPFCTQGMYRGWAHAAGDAVFVGIHDEAEEALPVLPPLDAKELCL